MSIYILSAWQNEKHISIFTRTRHFLCLFQRKKCMSCCLELAFVFILTMFCFKNLSEHIQSLSFIQSMFSALAQARPLSKILNFLCKKIRNLSSIKVIPISSPFRSCSLSGFLPSLSSSLLYCIFMISGSTMYHSILVWVYLTCTLFGRKTFKNLAASRMHKTRFSIMSRTRSISIIKSFF